MSLPDFGESEDLPPGIHRATLRETLERFGAETPRRKVIASDLARASWLLLNLADAAMADCQFSPRIVTVAGSMSQGVSWASSNGEPMPPRECGFPSC